MFKPRNIASHVDGLCHDDTEIHRLPGGSIDYDHYRRHARAAHGSAIRFAAGRTILVLRTLVARAAALLRRDRRRNAPLAPAVPAE